VEHAVAPAIGFFLVEFESPIKSSCQIVVESIASPRPCAHKIFSSGLSGKGLMVASITDIEKSKELQSAYCVYVQLLE